MLILNLLSLQGIVFVYEYALVRTLGKGSFGKVKLGLNTHDHELYALKLIPKSRKKRRGGPGAQPLVAEADVLQEINVMKELSHPNIVQLKEVIGEPFVLYSPFMEIGRYLLAEMMTCQIDSAITTSKRR